MAKKQKQADFLRVAEVAERLACSKRTVARRLKDGSLSGVTEGGRTLIHSWSVDAYLNSLQPVGGGK